MARSTKTTTGPSTARKPARSTAKPAPKRAAKPAAAKPKPAKAAEAVRKPAVAAAASVAPEPVPEPVVVEENRPSVAAPTLRKKALVDAVVGRSGVKPKYVKPALDALLAEIGEAIAEGRELNLPGLGKLKVQRSKKLANGDVYVARIRQPRVRPGDGAGPEGGPGGETGKSPDKDPKDPLAEAAE